MKMEDKPTVDSEILALKARVAALEAERERYRRLSVRNGLEPATAEDRASHQGGPHILETSDVGKPKPRLRNNLESAVVEQVRRGPTAVFKATEMAGRPVLGDRAAFVGTSLGQQNASWKAKQADNRLKAGWVDFVRVSDKLGLNYPQRCNLLGLTSQNDPQLRVFMGLKKLDQTKSRQPVPPRYDELLSNTAEILLERLPQISQLAQAMAQLDNTPGFYRHWPTWAAEPCATVAEFNKYAANFRREATMAEYAAFTDPLHLSQKLGHYVSPNTLLAPDDTTGVVPDPLELLTDRGAGLSKLTTWLQQECGEHRATLSPEQVQHGKTMAAALRDDVRDLMCRIKGFTKKLNL